MQSRQATKSKYSIDKLTGSTHRNILAQPKILALLVLVFFCVFFVSYRIFTYKSEPVADIHDLATKPSEVVVVTQTPQSTTPIPSPSPTSVPSPISSKCEEWCGGCTLYPVSKVNELAATYRPTLVEISLNGEGYLEPKTHSALSRLFDDAKSKGFDLRIISGFRAYETQAALFQNYVNNEIGKNPGINRDQAVENANKYSAKPGTSEHQLGTTVDITCGSCTPFAFDQSNQKVYDYLAQNANKFGFVISYPDGTEHMTGYKFEPWHIRYIGEEQAAQYSQANRERSGKLPLEEFLKSQCK